MEDKAFGKKKSRGLWSLLFSAQTTVVLMLAFQIAIMIWTYVQVRSHFVVIYGVMVCVGFAVVLYIVNSKDNPEYKIAMILPLLIFPVFGALLYVYLHLDLGTQSLQKSLKETHFEATRFMQQDPDVMGMLRKANPADANLVYYVSHQLGYPIHTNTSAQYFPSGEDMFEELLYQLEQAKDYIFMEYFIIDRGYMWTAILNILKKKAKEGVEVRVMYDGFCVVSLLPYHYPKKLESYGIHCKMFSPLKPALSTYQNNRDHRKICVIDGEVGFTGGINLADEYINRRERFGYWKDAAIMLRGNAVQNLTMTFLEMWNVQEKNPVECRYYQTPKDLEPARGNGFILPFSDSPFDQEQLGERVYFHMLEHAKKYVHIMTPYLVLDNDMIRHMKYAAKSGVEVVIIMPHIPDKWYAFALAKTYYEELIEAGVQIYEFTPGFVHAKVYVSDDDTAVVGTINCDYRSLFLHFECGAFIYRNRVVWDIEDDFQATLKKSQRVSLATCRKRSAWMKIAGSVLRLFAPLF